MEKVQGRLTDVPAATVEEMVDRAEERFLSRTRRQSVPARAFWVWVDTALEIHQGGNTGGKQEVSSVKRGDTTISYHDGAGGMGELDSRIDAYRVAVSR